jgi:hypothetical protein
MFKFAVGLFLGLSVSAAMADLISDGYEYDEQAGYMTVRVPTNGVLKGYIVENQDGIEICRNPMVFNEHKGPDSYVVCQQ